MFGNIRERIATYPKVLASVVKHILYYILQKLIVYTYTYICL
jgi:hypothetical protein